MIVDINSSLMGSPRFIASTSLGIIAFIWPHSISSMLPKLVPVINTWGWLDRLVSNIWSKEVMIECPRLTPFFTNNGVDGSTTKNPFFIQSLIRNKIGFNWND